MLKITKRLLNMFRKADPPSCDTYAGHIGLTPIGYDFFSEPSNLMRYVNTKHQIADFNTKAITKADTWWHSMTLAQIRPPKGEPGNPGGLHSSSKNSKSSSGGASSSVAQKQSLPTTVCVDSCSSNSVV